MAFGHLLQATDTGEYGELKMYSATRMWATKAPVINTTPTPSRTPPTIHPLSDPPVDPLDAKITTTSTSDYVYSNLEPQFSILNTSNKCL